MSTANDARLYAPATTRNREPILAVLQRILPETGTVLEVASGTGEHAIFFAPHLVPRQWQPSDPDTRSRASIAAWQSHFPAENLYPPLDLDVRDRLWSVERENQSAIAAIVSINMIHISPMSACLGLMAGAGRILQAGGILYLYGPFKIGGQHTAPSNVAFDEMLRSENPEWGVRNLDDIIALANSHNLKLLETIQMPANNLSVIFKM